MKIIRTRGLLLVSWSCLDLIFSVTLSTTFLWISRNEQSKCSRHVVPIGIVVSSDNENDKKISFAFLWAIFSIASSNYQKRKS